MRDSDRKIYSFSLKSDISEIKILSEQLKRFATLYTITEKDYHDVNLALEEWLTNLVRYGLKGKTDSKINITIYVQNAALEITVSDKGEYFDPENYRLTELNQPLDHRSPGGVGLPLIFGLMDHVSYMKKGNSNILKLIKQKTK